MTAGQDAASSGPRTPSVTVYITNHNYGRYIDHAIQSVLRQTLRDVELIVIDDGSTDDSRAIIDGYTDTGRLTAIHQQNRGLNITNNIALRAARGRYLLRLDADDFLDENALGVLAGVLDRNPEVGLVFPDYYTVDEEGHVLEVIRRHDFSDVTLMDQPAHGACTMIRRECLLELGGYDEAYRSQDGYELWLRFIRRFRVQNVNLPLFYYRQHGSSLTRNEESLLATRARILGKHAGQNGDALNAVAVIPLRGPSSDPASQALRPLGGRTLIDWTVEAALRARRIAGVVVTSPDDRVLAHVAGRFPRQVAVVRRERELARLNTAVEASVLHALDAAGGPNPPPDAVAILYIESPFRTGAHIDAAVHTMEIFGTDSVVGVRPDDGVYYQHHGAGLVPLRKTRLLRLERDDLLREAGQLYLVRREFLRKNRQIVGGRIGHVVLDQRASLRLRSGLDWQMAELEVAKDDPAGLPSEGVEMTQ